MHSGWISQAQCLGIGSWILQLKSAMSQGQLLPDEVIFRLLSKRLEHGASCGESGFILDGFPRTVNQAVWLLENVWDFFWNPCFFWNTIEEFVNIINWCKSLHQQAVD